MPVWKANHPMTRVDRNAETMRKPLEPKVSAADPDRRDREQRFAGGKRDGFVLVLFAEPGLDLRFRGQGFAT
jgi:hypothetical protein